MCAKEQSRRISYLYSKFEVAERSVTTKENEFYKRKWKHWMNGRNNKIYGLQIIFMNMKLNLLFDYKLIGKRVCLMMKVVITTLLKLKEQYE